MHLSLLVFPWDIIDGKDDGGVKDVTFCLFIYLFDKKNVHGQNFRGIFTGAMALNLKDRDDKWHDTIKKNGRNRQRSPCV